MTFSQGNTKASKLKGEQVMEIREKYAGGRYTQAMLSREYQVSISTIRNIIYGVTWQQLPGVVPEEATAVQAKHSEQLFKELESVIPAITIPPIQSTESGVDPVEEYMRKRKEGSK